MPSHRSTGCLISLGSNLEWGLLNPVDMISSAIYSLAGYSITIKKISRFFRTPAFPSGSGPDFVNAAILIRSHLEPKDLLSVLHEVEQKNARIRKERWSPRTLDLDLLSYGDAVRPNINEFSYWSELPLERQLKEAPGTLILPHPRLHQRAFVLGPLMDIVPDWVHPVLQISVKEMYAQLSPKEREEIRPF